MNEICYVSSFIKGFFSYNKQINDSWLLFYNFSDTFDASQYYDEG